MATYYVRPDGNNGNTGTGSGTGAAWQTITKALGATGIASGDTVYIAPGTYREAVTVAMTSATVETFVIGDVSASQFSDLQGGDVIWTSYTTNDKTAPSAGVTLALSARDFLTFRDIIFNGPAATTAVVTLTSATSTDITFTRCTFLAGRGNGSIIVGTALVDAASNWTFNSCIFHGLNGATAVLTLPTSTTADYDAEIVFRNCLILGGLRIEVTASGANSFKGGGVKVYNSTLLYGSTNTINVSSANVATSAGNQCEIYNCIVLASGTSLSANTSGQLVEDYNLIYAGTPRSNVSAGANSISSGTDFTYALLVHLGQEQLSGQHPRPFYSPMLQSPLLGFGNDGSIGVQTVDAFGVPRPSGPARTWGNASKAIGYSERPNTGQRETTTVRTGGTSLKLLGPSIQEVEIPVTNASTTVTVYARFDSNYGGGTLPRMRVMANPKIGVSEATDTVTVGANTWEQLSLGFTPTANGVVTVRFMSDGDGDGGAFFDDFNVA